MSLPTEQGYELSWTSAEVIVFDIDPSIAGVLGSDFLTDDGGLDLSLLGGGGTGGLGGIGDLLGGGGLGDLSGLLGGGAGGLGDLSGLLGGGAGGLGDLSGLLGGLGGGGGDVDLDGLLGGIFGAASGEDEPVDPIDDLLGGLGDLGNLGGLLGGLGGLGGGGGDLFAAFPLESNFDRIHLDFRDYEEGEGHVYFDLNTSISNTILNGDHRFDASDIDDMSSAIGSDLDQFDLDGDAVVTIADRDKLITEVFQTVAGDTDLDGDIDFADFLVVSTSFGTEGGGWASGDYDGNGITEFADFLALSTNFTGVQPGVSSVPEPNSSAFVLVGMCVAASLARRRCR